MRPTTLVPSPIQEIMAISIPIHITRLIADEPFLTPERPMTFSILRDGFHILNASVEEAGQAATKGFERRIQHFGSSLMCYSPTSYPYRIRDHRQTTSTSFISLSITGRTCSLNCEHCNGRLLRGMEPVLTPEGLVKRCKEVKAQGAEGVLISGGSDSEGHVPLAHYAEEISTIKKDIGLKVVVHTGLVDDDTARILAKAKVDAAMLDVIGDERVARDVYHIENGPAKMDKSLEVLARNGVPTVPHVLVGLNYGQLGGELEALHLISRRPTAAVVIIILSPIKKTAMEGVEPPTPDVVGRFMTIARLGLERTPLLLGCARPIGKHKIESDRFAVKSGMNGIAYISQEGVDLARSMGLRPVFRDACCSLAPHDLIQAALS
ncbi:MAG: hypothetical protein C4K49_00400 [Candidatus Thorarchaeota archaeon]|nr:MAG: hypothetical protein C4K49_00400 [Candidatus Thorarchaeota archaeon]